MHLSLSIVLTMATVSVWVRLGVDGAVAGVLPAHGLEPPCNNRYYRGILWVYQDPVARVVLEGLLL